MADYKSGNEGDGRRRSYPPAELAVGDGGAVVALRGELDIATAAHVTRVLTAAFSQGDSDVIVDLAAVEFIDAATIEVLAGCTTLATLSDRRFVLQAPASFTRRILQICGLAAWIEAAPEPV
jgi:anti-anti-sigma factor